MNPRLIVMQEFHEVQDRAFAWGEEDCLAWCARCAIAITGRDPAARLRGRYDSAESARAVMAEEGWRTLRDLARSMYDEIPVAQAMSGDWALIVNEDRTLTLGVVCGHLIVARTESNGLATVPLQTAKTAFRVA